MYRYGENHIRQHHRRIILLLVGILAFLSLGIWAVRYFHGSTTKIASPPVTSRVSASPIVNQHINLPLFSIDIPQDWKADNSSTTSNKYVWTNTGKDAGIRALVLYIDTDESGLGLNRAISVQANGDHLTTTSDVSDNCAGFTGKPASGQLTAAPAKWNGINFLCDLGNYERDVVGTVAQDGINKIVMTGQTAGSHNIFFTYTDNGVDPDYTVFVNALQSFRLK